MANARGLYARSLDIKDAEAVAVRRIPADDKMKRLLQNSVRDLGAGYPFLASLAGSDSVFYHAVMTDQFPVLATDGVAIYLNAAPGGWFDPKWNDDNRVFSHAHEVLHIMREDCLWQHTYAQLGYVPVPRTPTCPDGRLPFKLEYWQACTDAIINSGLIADKVGEPLKGCITHPAITWATSTGEAYAIIYQENEKGGGQGQEPGQGDGQGQGQGKPPPNARDPLAGDQRAPGSMGDPEGDSSEEASQPQDRHQAAEALQRGTAERQVALKRAISAARQAGTEATFSEQMTERAREPGVDWRSYMQGFLARAMGNSAYDFRRPARPPQVRELVGEQAFFAPSRGGNGCNHIASFGDVSGSIGEDEHMAILSSMCEMARDLNPKTISVTWCCTRIHRVDVFDGVPGEDELVDFYAKNPIPRGGGTSFIPPFEMLADVANGGTSLLPGNMSNDAMVALLDAGKPDGVIYFTDLDGPFPREKPDYSVLWVSVDPNMRHPWGERVDVDPQELLP